MASAQDQDENLLRTAAKLPPEDTSFQEASMSPEAGGIISILQRRPGFFGLIEESLRGFRRDQIDNRLLYSSPEVLSHGYGVPVGFYAPDILRVPQGSSTEALIHGTEVFADYLRVIFMDWDLNGASNYQVSHVNCRGNRIARHATSVDEVFFIFFEDFRGKNLPKRDFERQVYDHPLNRGLISIQRIWPAFDMIAKESYRSRANEARECRLTKDEYFVPTFEGSGERNISNRSRFVSQVQDILNDVPRQLKELEMHTKKGTGVMAQELFYTTYKLVDKLEHELELAQCAFSNNLFNVNEARAAHKNGEEKKGVSKWLLSPEPRAVLFDTTGHPTDSHSEGRCTPKPTAGKKKNENKRGSLLPEMLPGQESTRKRRCTESKEQENMPPEDIKRSIEGSSPEVDRDRPFSTEAWEMGDIQSLTELSEFANSTESTPCPTGPFDRDVSPIEELTLPSL